MNYVDLPHTPRYFFGYGLSYTAFEYSAFTASASEIGPDECVTLSAVIKNTGDRDGDEVVQLYVTDRYASQTRPVQELAGFARIHLKAQQSANVSFTVHPSQFAFLDQNMKWKIEQGDYDFRIGSSSMDPKGSLTIHVNENAWAEGKKRTLLPEVHTEPIME